jgi:4-hydroxymandelate oxidase
MAAQAMAHPDGEVAMTRAAAAAGIPMIVSTSASTTPEDVASAVPDADRLFQLYLMKDLATTRSLAVRAEATGYRAIVLTVDLLVFGYRERDRRSGFTMPRLPNVEAAGGATRGRYRGLDEQRAMGLTWADIGAIRSWTGLPLILKGILAPDDARLAVEHGVDAIIVSNHGARQLDRSLATADALPEVVAAVDGRAEVWVDGGIRRGLDIAIAMSLGATGVLVASSGPSQSCARSSRSRSRSSAAPRCATCARSWCAERHRRVDVRTQGLPAGEPVAGAVGYSGPA